MITFKRMWEDVFQILKSENMNEFHIIKPYSEGFIIEDSDDITFVTKGDFVDFWCQMQYFKEVSINQLTCNKKSKLVYVYDIVKNLPYIEEVSGILRVVED